MHLFDKHALALVLSAVATLAVTACSTPPIANDVPAAEQNDGDEQKSEKEDTSAKPEGETETPAQQTPTEPAAADCAATTTAATCGTCCDPQNAVAAAFTAFDSCVCASPGTCAQACQLSYCAGAQPDAACKACLDGATACNQQAEAACDANCQAAMQCSTTNACSTKP